MIDRATLRQDAEYVLHFFEDGTYADRAFFRIAHGLLALLNEDFIIPEGYALVKKPELLGLGVPSR